VSGVRILEEPVFERALMRPLALDDMGTHESDTAMDELTEQLRLEAQKQVREVGKVRGLVRKFSRIVRSRDGRAGVRSAGVMKRIEKVSHVDDQMLQFADAQMLDEKVSFARKEQLVACSEGGQWQCVEAGSVIDVRQ
jgi:hypothetical protein